MTTESRRTFLQSSVVGATWLALGSTLRAAGPNERVRIGLIGCGVRGRSFFPRADAVCDPDESRLAQALSETGLPASQGTTDMRRIFDDKSLDAVVIAAPDHWHAPAALLALAAGKHVYLEKPCCHNFREGQLLVEAATRTGLVIQHGTQQRSRPATIEAIQMLHDGIIGEVLAAKAWNVQERGNIGHSQPGAVPAGVDYDTWVGPAEFVPFQQNRFHKDWHWWRNFGTGDIGNDGAHELDYARWGLGVDTFPSLVTAVGGKYFYDDDQEFPDTATCVFEYPGAGGVGQRKQLMFEMRLWSRNYPYNCDSGVEFYGTRGLMFLSKRGKLKIIGPKNEVIREERTDRSQGFEHLDNFVDAIRNTGRPRADILTAVKSVAPIHLANISLQVGRSVRFDPETQTVVDDAEANQLLGRSYRQGGHWSVPEQV